MIFIAQPIRLERYEVVWIEGSISPPVTAVATGYEYLCV